MRGHGVVLVDDRHDAELEQLVERPLGVAVVGSPDDVVDGEQDLADRTTVAAERDGVALDQLGLSDAGGGLQRCQVTWPADQAERCQPGRDGTRGDQHYVTAAGPFALEGIDQPIEPVAVEPTGGAGQRGRAHLDDDAARTGHPSPSNRLSVPRGPAMPTPASSEGCQSKTKSPMVTSAPGSAPASASAFSTPSFASRSAR